MASFWFRSPDPPPKEERTVPVLALVPAVLVVTVEQLVQWQYGAAGVLGLLLLAIGVGSNRPGISSAGAVLLALLVTRPAL
ncbi:hypothetical protein ADK41_27320 [Streptomyces caelestis]|uniref:Uncharacterized protein n=2 Tax=Streptomyces TaxID=1883 RepID=A0A0N0S5L4_9ACTN|nr:hypothetical protein ADK41_27320 [Streptomyces caelestis]